MDDDFFRQLRLPLHAVTLLHRQGLHLLRASPGMAPSGAYWRLSLAPAASFLPPELRFVDHQLPAVRWSSGGLPHYLGVRLDDPGTTPAVVADAILGALHDKGIDPGSLVGHDPAYVDWFQHLVDLADQFDTVPIAFDDSPGPDDWHVGRQQVADPPPVPAAARPPA